MQRYTQLDDAIIIDVSGRDAARYLQSRLSNDVRALTFHLDSGRGFLSAMLSPQGKSEGFFYAARISEERFLLIADGGEVSQVMSALRRYIVADRVEVAPRSGEWLLLHLYQHDILSPEHTQNLCAALGIASLPGGLGDWCRAEETTVSVRKRCSTTGIDLLIPAALREALEELFDRTIHAEKISSEQREILRMSAGVPAFPIEINENRLFSETGIESAISFRKGCYVGQEVAEKIASYGRAPRRLLFALAPGLQAPPPPGESVEGALPSGAGRILGKVISACYDPGNNGCALFLEVKNEEALATYRLSVQGAALEVLPLGIE